MTVTVILAAQLTEGRRHGRVVQNQGRLATVENVLLDQVIEIIVSSPRLAGFGPSRAAALHRANHGFPSPKRLAQKAVTKPASYRQYWVPVATTRLPVAI